MDRPRGEIGRESRGAGPKLAGLNAFASLEHRIAGRRITIGSAPGNDLTLAHKSVAPHHAIIRNTRRGCYVRDLGSDTGTFLNGRRIEGEELTRVGDELRFGAARFAIVSGGGTASPLARYLGAAAGLLALMAIGYLAVNFIRNWSDIEQLASSSGARPPVASAVAKPVAPAIEKPPATTLSAPVANASIATLPLVARTAAPAWLVALNEYRVSAKLPPVDEDPRLSDADLKHATYIVKNYADKVSPGHLIGAAMHDETKGNQWYTPEGQDAGQKSDINQFYGFASPPTPTWALDEWMSGPFHRLWILNPRLHHVGYGEFCEKKYCVAALDLGSGAAPSSRELPAQSPIEFPADKSIVALNSLAGEWPSPLTACAGFSSPAGLPATIAFGATVDAKLSEYQLTRDGHGMEACGVDADTYQNPVASEQERGRAILHELGAVMIIPRYPLPPGRYAVTATVNDHAYQWSFSIAATGSRPVPHENAAASSTPASSSEFESALRKGYETATKSDAESIADYEDYVREQKAQAEKRRAEAAERVAENARIAAANREALKRQAETVALAEATVGSSAMKREDMRREAESAFPEQTMAPATGPNRWLVELNHDRAMLGLSQVTEDSAVTDGALKHATYIAMNYPKPAKLGAEMHTEDPAKPGYTPEGKAAASGEVAPGWFIAAPGIKTPTMMEQLIFIKGWLEAPFHRPSMLNANVHKAGFGAYCQGIACAAVLDLPESRQAAVPTVYAQPIFFPPPDHPIGLVELPGEWPNPLTACPNYGFPVGVPITIEIGPNEDAKLTAYSVRQNSEPIEACGYDATNFTNPDSVQLNRARGTMKANGEVIIVPRKPLTRGATYQVSATVNGHPYEWSFTVSK